MLNYGIELTTVLVATIIIDNDIESKIIFIVVLNVQNSVHCWVYIDNGHAHSIWDMSNDMWNLVHSENNGIFVLIINGIYATIVNKALRKFFSFIQRIILDSQAFIINIELFIFI